MRVYNQTARDLLSDQAAVNGDAASQLKAFPDAPGRHTVSTTPDR
jgi:hypothetical protein